METNNGIHIISESWGIWFNSVCVWFFFQLPILCTCQDQYPWVFSEIYSFCCGENRFRMRRRKRRDKISYLTARARYPVLYLCQVLFLGASFLFLTLPVAGDMLSLIFQATQGGRRCVMDSEPETDRDLALCGLGLSSWTGQSPAWHLFFWEAFCCLSKRKGRQMCKAGRWLGKKKQECKHQRRKGKLYWV